jgi:hypothetical protein
MTTDKQKENQSSEHRKIRFTRANLTKKAPNSLLRIN